MYSGIRKLLQQNIHGGGTNEDEQFSYTKPLSQLSYKVKNTEGITLKQI